MTSDGLRGRTVTFESCSRANNNVISKQYIFNSDVGPREGARVATSIGRCVDRCKGGAGGLAASRPKYRLQPLQTLSSSEHRVLGVPIVPTTGVEIYLR